MKKHFIPITIIVQTIITIILAIIGLNIKTAITQNIFFFCSLIISTIFWGILFKKINGNLFQGLIIGFSSICILVTIVSIYNSADSAFGFSRNKAFEKIKTEISNSYDLMYKTDMTSLYFDSKNKRIYSVTDVGDSKYFYQTNLSDIKNSEYTLLYKNGFSVDCLDKDINSMSIHPTTISNLTSYEHLIEISIDNTTYVAPTFIMGKLNYKDMSDKKILNVSYKDSDQNYDIYKTETNLLIQNNYSAFITPFVNVPYNSEVTFQNRYVEFMNEFYKNYKLPDNLTFGLSKTIEVNDKDIVRISFYYEIYDYENEGGLLMEIVHSDKTSDVCYIKEMYAEDLVSATVLKP